MKVLVIGASRGIGFELARQYRAEGHAVVGTVRDEKSAAGLQNIGAKVLKLDVCDAASCAGLTWPLDGERFDVAYLNAGVYGPRLGEMETPTQADFDQVMHTNVLAAMRLLPALPEVLVPGGKIAVLSSRMGSISLRAAGNASLYRASKAALNSVLKDAALVLGNRAICVALHPGWVRTDMGGPQADLAVADSVADIRRTVAQLSDADTGGYFNHDGTALTW